MEEKNLLTKPVKKKVAQKMVEVYRTQNRVVKVGSVEKKDTQSAWISKKALVDYLIFDNPMSTGVRIYFGVTGKYMSEVSYDCKDGYENQTNLILVATLSPNGEIPSMANSSNIILSNNLDSINIEEENKAFLFSGGEGMPLDDMELCPPSTSGCTDIV